MASTFDELKAEVLSGLILEVSDEPTYNEEKLREKVNNAFREVKRERLRGIGGVYPSHYTEAMQTADMEQFYSNIRTIALYDYNQIGIEGQTSSTESAITRTYVNRNSLFVGVLPLSPVFK